MIVWEWVGQRNSEKSLTRFVGAPSGGAYGPETKYDQVPPRKTVQLKADLVPSADAAVEEARLDTPSGTHTYTLCDGSTVTGTPVSCSRDQVAVGRENIRVSVEL